MATRCVKKTYRTYLESIKQLLDCIFTSCCLKFNNVERSLLKDEIFQIFIKFSRYWRAWIECEWFENRKSLFDLFTCFMAPQLWCFPLPLTGTLIWSIPGAPQPVMSSTSKVLAEYVPRRAVDMSHTSASSGYTDTEALMYADLAAGPAPSDSEVGSHTDSILTLCMHDSVKYI